MLDKRSLCWTVGRPSADFQKESLICHQVARCKWIPNDQDSYFISVLEILQAKAHQENTELKQNNITTIGEYSLW